MTPRHRDVPLPGQESVWDFPRPPALRPSEELVEIRFAGQLIASTRKALQVLETSHPPTYYLPREAFVEGALVPVAGSTHCEFKGKADYFDVVVGERVAHRAAWHYPRPTRGFKDILDHVAVMPSMMDSCHVDGEVIQPQEGSFYGGWITSKVSGPFKGGPATIGW
ncbi:MAG: DUF427 domain-containing protein [Propionibacteriaceae bacterium]|nr:DUF427 domain-containing protein [Propionibacteriaceae bacterium]